LRSRADFIEHIGEHNIPPLERAREIQAGFMGLGDDVADGLSQARL